MNFIPEGKTTPHSQGQKLLLRWFLSHRFNCLITKCKLCRFHDSNYPTDSRVSCFVSCWYRVFCCRPIGIAQSRCPLYSCQQVCTVDSSWCNLCDLFKKKKITFRAFWYRWVYPYSRLTDRPARNSSRQQRSPANLELLPLSIRLCDSSLVFREEQVARLEHHPQS